MVSIATEKEQNLESRRPGGPNQLADSMLLLHFKKQQKYGICPACDSCKQLMLAASGKQTFNSCAFESFKPYSK